MNSSMFLISGVVNAVVMIAVLALFITAVVMTSGTRRTLMIVGLVLSVLGWGTGMLGAFIIGAVGVLGFQVLSTLTSSGALVCALAAVILGRSPAPVPPNYGPEQWHTTQWPPPGPDADQHRP